MIRSIVTNEERLIIPSVEIHDWNKIYQIILDMMDTANHYRTKPVGCVGLAANQIGELYNIILIFHGNEWIAMVNPEIELIKGKSGYMCEGCLSRPGVQTKIQRHKKIRIKYLDPCKELDDNLVEAKFSGMTARIIQHEMDHLRGVYI